MNNYQKYCKPSLHKALQTMGLDVEFHRADQDKLFYYDTDTATEVEILDLLGGYGAVLLGHNDSELTKVATSNYLEQRPFNDQFAVRSSSANLAAVLNPIIKAQTQSDNDFLFSFCSTGAEAVEVAIKHAELARTQHNQNISKEIEFALSNLARQGDKALNLGTELQQKLGLQDETLTAKTLADKVRDYNREIMSQQPLYLALKHSFHGKLSGSIQLTHGLGFRGPFQHMGLTSQFIDTDNIEQQVQALFDELNNKLIKVRVNNEQASMREETVQLVSGLFVEPIQGEGGVHCLTSAHAQQLHAAAQLLGAPIISDEIQSGSGRSGEFLAGHHIGLKADYVILSKALGGGIAKIGLVAIKQSRYAVGHDLMQSSTFGEDGHSAEIARAYVERLHADEGTILSRIQQRGAQLKTRLEQVQAEFPDVIIDVRGRGLLLGVELKPLHDAESSSLRSISYQNALGYIVAGFMFNEHQLRVAPSASAPNVIRLEPSACLTDEGIERVAQAFEQLCKTLRFQDAYFLIRYLSKGFDNRLQRNQPEDYRGIYPVSEKPNCTVKVAFINHLISPADMFSVEPSMAKVSFEEVEYLMNKMDFDLRVAPLSHTKFTSKQGNSVEFVMYPLGITSAQISTMIENNELEQIRYAVDERVSAAKADGCSVAGLGMFTSVVTNNCKSIRTPDITLTTGNSLTVGMSVEAVKSHLDSVDRQVKRAAIVGAAGNIGTVYASMMTEITPQLVLIGSGRSGSLNRLQKAAESIYQDVFEDLISGRQTEMGSVLMQNPEISRWVEQLPGDKTIGKQIFALFDGQENAPIKLSNELSEISRCELLVCATNASQAFIEPELLQQNTIICDVSVPHNIDEATLAQRPDITCIRGGVVATPHKESLAQNVRAYLNAGEVYACMAETILLGLDGTEQHYSYGDLSKSKVNQILDMADKHGFSLSQAKVENSM